MPALRRAILYDIIGACPEEERVASVSVSLLCFLYTHIFVFVPIPQNIGVQKAQQDTDTPRDTYSSSGQALKTRRWRCVTPYSTQMFASYTR